jgi:leucyl-tRNA synthetase
MRSYDHTKIEKKWQEAWNKAKLYEVPDSISGKENFYLLVEFPYPSGNLHVGHWYAFAVPDILARHLRMKGKNVLYPIGFDAFGLPAENAAIKNGINPRVWTENNMAYMRKQIASMGTSFDTSREVVTCHPEYYKWTQWLFLQLFKAGLAYRKQTAVNWCPKDKTVLANEQVVAGKCERCGTEVEQRQMLQWNLKITDYADRLVDDLEPLNWPEEIKESQRNWIGRSLGAEIDFPLELDGGKKYKYVILHGYKGSPEGPRWQWVKKELEAMGHEVIVPALPHSDHPLEDEQVATALTATQYDENTVLVGHSLGAVVALKVAEKLKKPIARLVLIAGFADRNFKDKKRGFEEAWNWNFDAKKIQKNAPSITVLHDPRDYAVSDAQVEALAKMLDVSITIGASNEPHFVGDKEPDVLMWLRPTIRVFTTRADTLYGATYLVLAPEHPWVKAALEHKTVLKNNKEVLAYVEQTKRKTDLERQTDVKEKTGVKLEGVEAINPVSGERMPLYVADYVLGHYGTGAIMAVPAHDDRDFAFAEKFKLPIKQVVAPVVRSMSGSDAVHEGEPFRERMPVMCIVKHAKKDEYLCIQWKEHPEIRSFVSGGIEEGEELIEAGKREVLEETGYKNLRFVRQVGGYSWIEFYHQLKKTNIRAKFRYLYFELENDEQDPIAQEEQRQHEVLWKKEDEVLDFITLREKERVWNAFLSPKEQPYLGGGKLVNSGEFDGLTVDEAKQKMTEQFGRTKTTYKLRDWIVSRQRYWGVPIPIVHCEKCGAVAVPEDQLPILLPDVEDYLPSGEGKSPLAKVASFVNTTCPQCGGSAERETDTFDTFVDSSWYFLRYTDPKNTEAFASSDKQTEWMPIDLYSGGAEHTTMHLLYSRFWHKALFDLKLVVDAEPYSRRMNRSIILGPDNQKMSKSRGNVIDPDEIVKKLGADTVRMYLAFVGPYNEVGTYPWNPDGVVGVRRFIERVWRAQEYLQEAEVVELDTLLHKTIKKVGEDTEALKFNTAMAQLMIFLNDVEKHKKIGGAQWRNFLKLLAPFAPHVAEELWQETGHESSIHLEQWPVYDKTKLTDAVIKIAVQINGKTRADIEVPADTDKSAIEVAAHEAVATRILGKKIGRTIIVPGRLVNFVLED